MKKGIILICMAGLAVICLVSCILSYDQLDRIPYGFHIDEMAGSVDVGCMVTEGVDAHNVPHPFFSNLNYGTPKPPTFIYPAMLWAKAFGYSAPSLRALSVTVHLAGIVGLFFLSRLLFGHRCALLTILVACLSPWTWGMGRVAFESLFAASFLIWGMYFFFKSTRPISTIISALLFAAAMYSYPPFRLQTPLMLMTLFLYSCWKNKRSLSSWMVFALTVILPMIPVALKTLNGEIQQRFNSISIFSKDYLKAIHSSGSPKDIMDIFINNYLLHLKPGFLFFRGDPSYVHSTRHFGILGWVDILALVIGLIFLGLLVFSTGRKNNPLVLHRTWIIFLIMNILIGIIPAALTNSELPNALRITGAWPFMCLLNGFLLWQACERCWGLWIAIVAVSLIFAVAYFHVYFKVFPQEGKGMFYYWTLEQAKSVHSDQDWIKFVWINRYDDYNARYFLMQYKGLTCSESRKVWEGMRDYLTAQGKYY